MGVPASRLRNQISKAPFAIGSLWVSLILLSLFSSLALSDSRRVIEYQYDAAGNLIQQNAAISTAPPVVTGLTPSTIRIGFETRVTASGTDLVNAQVTADDTAMAVNVVSSSNTEVVLDISPGSQTSTGAHTLTFTTTLGSATAQLVVRPFLVLSVSPSPVTAPIGGPTTLDVRLSTIDIVDHTLNFSTGNSAIATVTPASITIPAGQTQSGQSVIVNGIAEGNTGLQISSTELPTFSTPIFVTGLYQPPVGANRVYSSNLGVVVTDPPEGELIQRGPFISPPLQVVKEFTPGTQSKTINPIASPILGVSIGGALNSVTPNDVIVDSGPTNITINGSGLAAVDAISLVPPDDITLGPFTVAPSGDSITIPVTVGANASIGMRRFVVSAAGQRIPPSNPQADRLHVSRLTPIVESISPITLPRGTSSAAMVIRGRNFEHLQSVQITPSNGISLSAPPVANAQGTQVSFQIAVAESAPLGARVISVVTVAGSSSQQAAAANTLTITNGPGQSRTPLASANLGVQIGSTNPEPTSTITPVYSPALGVTFSGVITGLSPAAAAIGESLSLTIQGEGLSSVTGVAFTPDTGLTLGAPNIAADGKSITVSLDIASDAPQTPRQLSIFAGSTRLLASPVTADRFLVTGLIPILDSIRPYYLIKGAAATTLTLRGSNLDGASAVRAIPSDGISMTAPVVNAAGTLLTVTATADATAVASNRVLSVTTAGGESSTVPAAGNTLQIANQVVSVFTPISASQLGVVKQQTAPAPVPVIRGITSPNLGVDVQQPPTSTSVNRGLYTTNVGVSKGAIGFAVSPAVLNRATSVSLVINGTELGNVTAVDILPADGITIDGPFQISADGLQITLPITVASDAPSTIRKLALTTASGALFFAPAANGHIRISDGLAEITSIVPIQELQGETFNLQIRGINLQGASAVTMTPAAGVTFANTLSVNAQGTEVNILVSIDAAATPGARVIQVVTPASTSTANASPANSFTVVATP